MQVMIMKLVRNLRKYKVDVTKTRECTLFRKKVPEILIFSHLMTTIFWPENLLEDYRSQLTKEMTFAINYNGSRGECGHLEVCIIVISWQSF